MINKRKTKSGLLVVLVASFVFLFPSIGCAESQDQDPINMANELIEKNPTYAYNYVQRALIYQIQKEYDLAMADFDKAILINPNYMEAYHDRGVLYSAMHQTDKAIEDFNKAISIRPSDLTYNARGIAFIEKDQPEKAIEDFSKAINLDPTKPIAYYHRAMVYSDKKDYDKSWQDVSTLEKLGVEVDPGFLSELEKASGRKR